MPTMTKHRPTVAEVDRERADVCCHEASHCIAATVLGGMVDKSVVLSREHWTDIQGWTEYAELPDAIAAPVTFAGPWAQARRAAGRRPTSREIDAVFAANGCRDHRKLTAAGGVYDTDADRIVPVLERCWPSIISLAAQLYRNGQAGHSDVLDALGIGYTDDLQMAVASIRAGAVPGSFRCAKAAVR